ncbi:MAG TPA: DUF262 domain-containing HNH endonuclease family protein [Balneolaceae bacterium]|nr:DUF262 domain-containing HNH endonuclease family protein [Balneolaceae bacterium]
MKANELKLGQLLATTANVEHYYVPKYQREYTWGKNEWRQLLQDIEENDKGYFMGSIICVPKERGGGYPTIYDLIDGQQRLTTIGIILAAIYRKYELSDFEIDEDLTFKKSTIKKRLIIEGDKDLNDELALTKNNKDWYMRVRPSAQGDNLDDYLYLISSVGLLKDVSKPKYFGNRRIGLAFNYFFNELPEERSELDNLLNKIETLTFVHITADSQADAFVLFESLNNRGVPLSIMDIVKNKMLGELETEGNLNLDEAFDKWQILLKKLPDYKIQERFLRHYYNAFKEDREIDIEGQTRATRANLVRIYEENISKGDELWLLKDLIKESEVYSKLVYPENRKGDNLKRYLKELLFLGSAPVFSFLLYLEQLEIDPKEKVQIYRLLCDYFFRRKLTDKPATRSLDYIFLNLIRYCRNKNKEGEKIRWIDIESELTQNKEYPIADLNTVVETLKDDIYLQNRVSTWYALYRLETSFSERDYQPNLWGKDGDKFIWTVEHVLPQGENIPAEWVNMIANGDYKKAKKIHASYVHKIGNLTLTLHNSKLSNRSFDKKQTLKKVNVDGREVKIGLKNRLALNKLKFRDNGSLTSLDEVRVWNDEHIKERSKKLIQELIKLISFSWEDISNI